LTAAALWWSMAPDMSNVVIRVSGLGKQYRLGAARKPYRTLRDSFADTLRAPLTRRSNKVALAADGPDQTSFWALKNVNFEIQLGEVVGIIGRNGAGKSTLLKILSRITDPTEGEIEITGRVGSLLEVGTGFHPELTGRENIYLNGAILGMKRTEITRRFDEIVSFAETEKFLDTPVKFYSSGMYTRLAFAVAAHLEPEILVVDEVLAVGDAEFQKKCMGKMSGVAKQGRTVLFVSHNMPAVRSLCKNAIVLDHGAVAFQGNASTGIDMYLTTPSAEADLASVSFVPPAGAGLWVEKATVLVDREPAHLMKMGQSLAIELQFGARTPITAPHCSLLISRASGEKLVHVSTRFLGAMQSDGTVEGGRILCDFGQLPLVEGRYDVSFWIGRNTADDHHIANAFQFEVIGEDIWKNGWLPAQETSCMWWPARFSLL
jgi:lipopolysaccharide transport system ATP-binding protein